MRRKPVEVDFLDSWAVVLSKFSGNRARLYKSKDNSQNDFGTVKIF